MIFMKDDPITLHLKPGVKLEPVDMITRFPVGSKLTLARMDDGALGIVVAIPGDPDRGVNLHHFSNALMVIAWYLMADNPVEKPQSEKEWADYNEGFQAFLAQVGKHRVE
jgi:hypothetical protein